MLTFGGYDVSPSQSVRNFGAFCNADLSLRSNIDVFAFRCFAALRQLRIVRHYVPLADRKPLVTSLDLTRLDFCNSVAFGLPAVHLRRL